MNIERWAAMLSGLGLVDEADTFDRLRSAYAEKHRAYHTARHIDECLALHNEFKQLAEHADEVEFALWFHDAIYEPMSKSNEERSAKWAQDFGERQGMSPQSSARISSHIMSTRHVAPPSDGDSRLVVDIDLAILGADAGRYAEFERDVRQEYRWVPRFIYRSKRAQILQSFLDRGRIYQHQPLFERFEARARVNLSAAISALAAGD